MRDKERERLIEDALQVSGLDLLVSGSSADIRMLTGYWPVMGVSFAMVTPAGDVRIIVPEDERELAEASTHAACISYQPASLDTLAPLEDVLREPFRSMLAGLGFVPKIVGMPTEAVAQPGSYLSTHHLRGLLQEVVQQVLPQSQPVSADTMLAGLRSVKTRSETDALRHACALASRGFAAAETAIAAGRREDEVAADIQASFVRVANDGFERGMGSFFCMSGPNSTKAAGAYARTRQRVLENGDLVMIHANTVGDGLWTDLTRTYTVGAATDQHERMRAAIQEARDAAFRRIAPGAKALEVNGEARGLLERHGFGGAFKHALGHGVGFAAADAGAFPRLHPSSPDVLAAGMTFNVEPALYLEGVGGMRHCDVVACTAEGVDLLSRF